MWETNLFCGVEKPLEKCAFQGTIQLAQWVQFVSNYMFYVR